MLRSVCIVSIQGISCALQPGVRCKRIILLHYSARRMINVHYDCYYSHHSYEDGRGCELIEPTSQLTG